MAKVKTAYVCGECGSDYAKWQGQCTDCGQWNTIKEVRLGTTSKSSGGARSAIGYAGVGRSQVQKMAEVSIADVPRIVTGMEEMDRVFGGGLVPGGIALLGGDPGIGKSTILLQLACHLSLSHKTLYVTGEESPEQVAARAKRLDLPHDQTLILAETEVERILAIAEEEKPQLMVIDSIQTMHMSEIESAPGSVSQVRESAAVLTRFAKQTNTSVILVGHMTKDGLAGPKTLEHIVDSVIFIEGRTDSRFRIMRAMKNRFGAVNELGVFGMTDKGMKEVKNPSAIFLARMEEPAPGSLVVPIWEGTRPLLVEIQALMDESHGPNPRRVTVGMEQNRLAMLLAVLHRHGGIPVHDQDVFINVVGGVKISETSADLALLMAVISSLKDKPLPQDLIVFGEVGLAGEIRPVNSGPERLKEAAKHGFKKAIVPKSNMPKDGIPGMKIIGVNRLSEALAASRDL